jgi:hypothetical protein
MDGNGVGVTELTVALLDNDDEDGAETEDNLAGVLDGGTGGCCRSGGSDPVLGSGPDGLIIPGTGYGVYAPRE